MHTNVWVKYLPIIRIVLKRSLVAEQTLALNAPDFHKFGLARKSGYKFLLKIRNGKLDNVIIDSPIASSLVSSLMQDERIKEIFNDNEFNISLNPKFELTIKHIPSPVKIETEEVVLEEAEA